MCGYFVKIYDKMTFNF